MQTVSFGAAPFDWVLAAGTDYYRIDETTGLFTTNSNAIITAWPMENPVTP